MKKTGSIGARIPVNSSPKSGRELPVPTLSEEGREAIKRADLARRRIATRAQRVILGKSYRPFGEVPQTRKPIYSPEVDWTNYQTRPTE